MSANTKLPAGYHRVVLGDIDSTNTEAFRRADAGSPDKLWLTCSRQTIGRGRGERSWESEPGNLYSTLLLQLDVPLPTALQLPFVAGVALHRAVIDSAPTIDPAQLALKWPNDLLLNGEKLAGILVESRNTGAAKTLNVALGFGVNVAHHPAETRHPATHLAAHDTTASTERLFEKLASALANGLIEWREGAGFDRVRESWSQRSLPLGQEMSVSSGDSRLSGTYAGLDVDGALLLNVSGNMRRILFGDVMFPGQGTGAP